jgi:hypothetical protein
MGWVEDTERAFGEMPVDILACYFARLYAEVGRTAEARALVEDLAEIDFDLKPYNDKLVGWCVLAEVCSSLSESGHAARLHELLSPYPHRHAVCHPSAALARAAEAGV